MQEMVVGLTVEWYAHGGHVIDDGPGLQGKSLLSDACQERVVYDEVWFYALRFHLAYEPQHWDETTVCPGMTNGLFLTSGD